VSDGRGPWIDRTPTFHKRKAERISPGKKYKVIGKVTNNKGERVWCFEIPQPEVKDNPFGSGWFNIDEYFITLEEERSMKIDEILT